MESILLSPKQTNEYIKKIKDLELACYEQNLLYENLQKRLEQVKANFTLVKNKLSEEISEDGKPGEPLSAKDHWEGSIMLCIMCMPIGCIIGVIWRLIVVFFRGCIMRNFSEIAEQTPILPYVIGGAVGIAIVYYGLWFMLFGIRYDYSSRFERYKSELKEWEERKKREKVN